MARGRRSPAFVLQGRRRDDCGPIRVGFTVTKKNGTATERNRIRRRLRELVKRLDVISMRPHSDYVLVGRRAALTAISRPCSTISAPRSTASTARCDTHRHQGRDGRTRQDTRQDTGLNDET